MGIVTDVFPVDGCDVVVADVEDDDDDAADSLLVVELLVILPLLL